MPILFHIINVNAIEISNLHIKSIKVQIKYYPSFKFEMFSL